MQPEPFQVIFRARRGLPPLNRRRHNLRGLVIASIVSWAIVGISIYLFRA